MFREEITGLNPDKSNHLKFSFVRKAGITVNTQLFIFLAFPHFPLCFLETPLNTISTPTEVVLVKESHMAINKNLQSIWKINCFSFHPQTSHALIYAVNLAGLLLSKPKSSRAAQEPAGGSSAIQLSPWLPESGTMPLHWPLQLPLPMYTAVTWSQHTPCHSSSQAPLASASASGFSSPTAANLGNHSTFQGFP